MALATTTLPPTIVSNSSIDVYLRDDPSGPRLAWIEGAKIAGAVDHPWSNSADEPLPPSVEVNGVTVPLRWQLKSELGHADPHHVVFVYESDQPHLRLRWEWEARADFGPVEHRITIQNLSGDEIWLPMVDSLRLDWRTAPARELRNFYVEKGADIPSAEGTHLDSIVEGYNWTGKSTTYAHPAPGEKREIIPAEIVYRAEGPQSGWYAGIEFSGRTRISLERNGDSLKSVLGLDPEPGPFKTRLEPGETFETPTVFLGAFDGGPDGAGNQLRPWVRAVLGNPLTWKDPQYPLMVNNSWGSGMEVDEALALRMIGESKGTRPGDVSHRCGLVSRRGRLVSRPEEVSPRPGCDRRRGAQTGSALRHLDRLDAGRARYRAGCAECAAIPGSRLAGCRSRARLETGRLQGPDHRHRRSAPRTTGRQKK